MQKLLHSGLYKGVSCRVIVFCAFDRKPVPSYRAEESAALSGGGFFPKLCRKSAAHLPLFCKAAPIGARPCACKPHRLHFRISHTNQKSGQRRMSRFPDFFEAKMPQNAASGACKQLSFVLQYRQHDLQEDNALDNRELQEQIDQLNKAALQFANRYGKFFSQQHHFRSF